MTIIFDPKNSGKTEYLACFNTWQLKMQNLTLARCVAECCNQSGSSSLVLAGVQGHPSHTRSSCIRSCIYSRIFFLFSMKWPCLVHFHFQGEIQTLILEMLKWIWGLKCSLIILILYSVCATFSNFILHIRLGII